MTRPRLLSVLAVVLCALAGAGAALAARPASRHGVTPLAPADGATIPRGKSPTFRVLARGGGKVFVRVCRSPKQRSNGLICAREMVGMARRSRIGVYRYRPPFRDYPGFWLNQPGTYHWQAHRVRCERRRTKDCRQEGPVLSLTVK